MSIQVLEKNELTITSQRNGHVTLLSLQPSVAEPCGREIAKEDQKPLTVTQVKGNLVAVIF